MHQTITRERTRPGAPSARTIEAPAQAPAAQAPAPPAPAVPAADGARRPPVRNAAPGRPAYTESTRSMAGVAILLGAAGLFVFNVVLGPLAIGVGAAALRREPASPRTRTAALAGLALGLADLVVLAVLVGVSLSHGAINWHFGA